MKYTKKIHEWILVSPSSFIVLLLLTWYIYIYRNIVHTQQTGVQNSSFFEEERMNVLCIYTMTNWHSFFHCWVPWNIAILKKHPRQKKDKAAFCLFFFATLRVGSVQKKKINGGQGENRWSDTGIRPSEDACPTSKTQRGISDRPLRGANKKQRENFRLKTEGFDDLFFFVGPSSCSFIVDVFGCQWRCPNGESPRCSSRMFQTTDLYVLSANWQGTWYMWKRTLNAV